MIKKCKKTVSILGISIVLFGVVSCSILGADNLKAYLAVYIASLRNLPDRDLIKNFNQNIAVLSRGENPRDMLIDETRGTQLPIVKIPELKAIVFEIERRIKAGKINLLSSSELEKAKKLISEKEAEMGKGRVKVNK